MHSQRRTRGITFIGFLIVLAVMGFFAYAAMRLVPIYIENDGVKKSMDLVANEPGASQKTIEQVRGDLSLKFSIQYVDDSSIPPQSIQVIRQGGGATLRVAYQRRVNFAGNVDLLVSFDRSVPMAGFGPG
ncbi:MAG: DUF4845 domain-containing protein [Dokdonella sp.]